MASLTSLLLSSLLSLSGIPPAPSATCVRDAFGVPHIQATDRGALMQAHGRGTAEDRLWQLEMVRRAARGRLAEIFGPGFIDADRQVRQVGYTEAELEDQLHQLPVEVQQDLVDYAAGINAGRSVQQARGLPFEFVRLGLVPQPWRLTDSIAVGGFLLRRFGEVGGTELDNLQLWQRLLARHGAAVAAGLFEDLRWQNDPLAPQTIDSADQISHSLLPRPRAMLGSTALGRWQRQQPAYRLAPPQQQQQTAPLSALWQQLGVVSRLGSFAFAVAPAQAGGVGLLYGGPQMSQSVPNIVHEVHLQQGDHHVRGMAIAGIPWVLIGATESLAWSTTSGKGDNLDLYVETLCKTADGREGACFSGRCEPLERRCERIDVAGRGPEMAEMLRSRHGPLRRIEPGPDGQAYGLAQRRQHWKREVEALTGFRTMNLATDFQTYAAAIPHFVTSHNFLYADRGGNIAYWQAGEVPEQPAGTDFRLPLPGDGRAEPTGRRLPIPHVKNPASGILANWNNKANAAADSSDNWYGGMPHRVVDLQERLKPAAGRPPLSFDEMPEVVADIARTGACGRIARWLKDPMLAAIEAHAPIRPAGQLAIDLLRPWSGLAIEDAREQAFLEPASLLWDAWLEAIQQALFAPLLADDVGAVLPSLMVRLLRQRLVGSVPGELPLSDSLRALPRGEVLEDLLANCLDAAVQALQGKFGSDPSSWQQARPTIPLNHPLLGKIGEIWLANQATYGFGAELGPAGVRMRSIFAPGQSGRVDVDAAGQPSFGPHTTDLLPLYRQFSHKPEVRLP
jgi:penicillin amidase